MVSDAVASFKKSVEKQRAAGFLGTAAQRTAAARARAGGGGAAGVSVIDISRQAKQDALNKINRQIRDATGAERERLIRERAAISNISVNTFTAQRASIARETVRGDIKREQQLEAERKQAASKEIQKSLFEKQLTRITTAEERKRIIEQAERAGFEVTPSPLPEGTLERRIKKVTAKGKVIKEERFPLLGGEVITEPKPPVSTIAERKRDETFAGKLTEKGQELEFEAQFREPSGVKKIIKTATAAGLTFAAVPVGIVTDPIGAVRGTIQQAVVFVKDPFGEAAKLKFAIETQPAGTIGTIAGIFVTGKLIPKGVKLAKDIKAKLPPVEVDIVAKKIRFRAAKAKGELAKEVIGIEDIKFAARIGKEEFGGVARGVGAVRKKGRAGFAFEVDVIKEGAAKPIRTEIAAKITPAKPRGAVFRGISISEAVTKAPTKEIIQRAITPFRGIELIIDKKPKTFIQAGVISKARRRLQLSLIEQSLTEKVRTFEKEGVGKVSVFEGAEAALGEQFIKRVFPKRRLGKRGELLAPPEQLIKFEPAIVTQELFGAIRKE